MNKVMLVLVVVVACLGACDSKPETLVTGGYDQAEMDAAIARAKSETDFFLSEFAKGNGLQFSVKAPIESKGEVEHFWLTDITYRDGLFEGTIGNDPGIVDNVKLGMKWSIKKADIADWLFMRDGKMHGNYTVRPLLKTMSPEDAARMRALLAKPLMLPLLKALCQFLRVHPYYLIGGNHLITRSMAFGKGEK